MVSRLPEIAEELSSVSTSVVGRAVFELIFGVKRRRAIQLMHAFGGYQMGKTFVIDRNRLITEPGRRNASDGFTHERQRKEKLIKDLERARKLAPGRKVRIDGTPDVRERAIADLPAVIAWTTPEEIASIDVQFQYFGWQEISDPLKWDPRNRETADHSMPYNIARHLIDKQIYLDSFTKEKYMDPAARELMNKIRVRPLMDRNLGGGTVLTVRKKSGEERVFEGKAVAPMSHDDLVQKYNRISDFMQIAPELRERARAQWTNLRAVRDIGEAIQTIAKFGRPGPLSDTSPGRIA